MTILTAKVGTNADLFPDVFNLYGKDPSLDMTFGNGVFWSKMGRGPTVAVDRFNPKATLQADFRQLPFSDGHFYTVVLDPPYMRTNNKAGVMASNYHNQTINLKTHSAIIDLYRSGMNEARRLLKVNGHLIIKCQDEVESRKQRWSHIELMSHDGFVCEDLLVLIRVGGILIGRCQEKQQHARKNHSYFVVLRKV